jgi:nucleotide-binding universal stress UspA family protein
MYKTILVTLDGTPTDRAIIEHTKLLAKLAGSRVILLHVADGWAARTYGPDAVSPEITEDKAYLQCVREELQSKSIQVDTEMAYGDPAREITKRVEQKHCDLVAMSTHGHRFLADLFLGTTASRVQHNVRVPVLLLRAKPSNSRIGVAGYAAPIPTTSCDSPTARTVADGRRVLACGSAFWAPLLFGD